MSGKEFLPFRGLPVLGQFVDLQVGIECFLNLVISPFSDMDRGPFVLILAAGINNKNLVLLVLIET
jgi:hypothetical protein